MQAIPDVKGFGAQVVTGTPLPNTPYMAALWDPVKHALQAIWSGKPVDAALAGAQTEAQNNIAKLK